MRTECASSVETDEEVIYQARLGFTHAFDKLVTRHRARAVRIARSFVRDKDLAEDIAQEAFVKTFLAISALKKPDAFTSYLTRTIVRLCIDHSRKSSSSEATVEIESPPPEQGVSAEDSIYIHTVLQKLSWKLRQMIVLRDVNGMDYAAIAKALRLPVGTVRSRLSAARAAFRKLYLGGIEGGSK